MKKKPMSKHDILKRISKALSPTKVDFSGLDAEINALKKKLEDTVNIQTVDDVKYELDKFKKKVDLTPLVNEINKIGDIFSSKTKDLKIEIDDKTKELEIIKSSITDSDTTNTDRAKSMSREISALRNKVAQIEVFHEEDVKVLSKSIEEAKAIEGRVNKTIQILSDNVDTRYTKSEAKAYIKEAQDKLDELRRELLTKIANIHGGGNMNRQIWIGGADPSKYYADLNLKAGSNVTITYSNNHTTRKLDITFASSGGGGGSVRSINSISSSQTAGSTSGTDYVYLVTGTTTLTMPTAVGNTNLYTIKNVGTGVVTVAFAGIETCDGSTTIVMPVQYTSVDIISDTVNWNIT